MLPPNKAKELAERTKKELKGIVRRELQQVEVTCEKCPYNDNCEYAWDVYNTGGDCLAEK